jgi:uncharacterized protein YhaN
LRIDRIDLRKYGHFDGQCLDFTSHKGKLIIVVGPNEAGKTMTLKAVCHWLYGFPKNMGGECHRLGNEVLVGGKLSAATTLECLRTRKKKSPLVALDGKTAIESELLHACLGDITEERFVGLFGLSHAELREGGKEIAAGQGHLGKALFAAASGLSGLRSLRKKVGALREALYLPKAKKPYLNVAKRDYEDAKDRLKLEIVSAPDVRKWTNQADEAKIAIEKASELREDAQAELRDLHRIASARPLLQRRSELFGLLVPMRGIPRLRAAFAPEWKPLPEGLAGQRKLIESHDSEIVRLDGILTNMPTVDMILSQADAIDKLHASSNQRTQAHTDKATAEQLVRDTGGEAKQALREIGLDPGDFDEHIDTLRVDPPIAKRLRKLANDLTGIEQETRTTRTAREETEEGILAAEKNVAELSSTTDRERLELLVARLDQGDPFAVVESLDAEIVASQQELNAMRKRVAIDVDWETATEWAIPTAETFRGFDARFTKEETDRRDFDRDLRAARAELRNAEASLATAEAEGNVPLPADWEAAKGLRDATWAKIQGVWLDGQPAEELPKQLAARFGGEIKDADELADRLRRDAERVTRTGQAHADRDKAHMAIRDQEGYLQATATRIDEAKTQWQDLWRPFGVVLETPKAMLEWRLSWESLVKAAGDYRSLLTRRESASRRRDDFLTDARAELGDDVAPGNVVAMVRRRHGEASKLQGQREQIEKNLKSLRDSLPKKRKLEDDAKLKRQSWDEQWHRIVERMPAAVRSDLVPASAADLIDGIDKFRGRIDFRRGRQGEVEKAVKAIENWDALFNEVAAHLGEQPAGDNPTVRVPGWKTRLETARATEGNRKSLTDRLSEYRTRLGEANEKLAALKERLRGLQVEAGAQSVDDIPEILRQVGEKETLEQRLEKDCESPLRELAAGRPLDELEALVRARHGQDLSGLIEAANGTVALAESNRDDAVNLSGAAKAELNQLHRKQGGLKSRADMESALARMRNLLPDYVVAVLAEKVLDRAVERYRDRNQDELFGSASSYFRRLTCGSFDDLILDEDDNGEAILVGLRPSGRVKVDGMSEGTRDQLYLALRLAHLEKHMRDHGPFPVILDDILLAFDDFRASAALRSRPLINVTTSPVPFSAGWCSSIRRGICRGGCGSSATAPPRPSCQPRTSSGPAVLGPSGLMNSSYYRSA